MKASLRILCMLIAVIMLLSVFGCGSKNTEEGKNKEGENQSGDKPGEKDDDGKLVITDTFYPQYPNAEKEYKEMREKVSAWFYENLENGTLFSAKLGSDTFDTIKASWTKNIEKGTDADGNETVVATYVYKNVKFTLEGTLYADYPTVDYTIWAESADGSNTPVLSSFNAIDSSFAIPAAQGYTIHTSKGSGAEPEDFALVEDTLTRGDGLKYNPSLTDGRGTSRGWPYFDVIGKDCGLMLAIGWTGIWQTAFQTTKTGYVDIKAYQVDLNTVILPGEKLRSPRVVLSYFDGDFDYGHNMFRKLIIEHYTPENDKENKFVAPLCINFWGGTSEEYLLSQLEKYFGATDKIKYIWMDAAWNGDTPLKPGKNSNTGDDVWTKQRGWWKLNTNIFPSGSLKKIAQYANKNDAEILLWIELETLTPSIAKKASMGADSYYSFNMDNKNPEATALLRLSDEKVLQNTIEWLSNLMEENGVNAIRLDFNQTPKKAWDQNDREEEVAFGLAEGERTGATQNKYVVNLLRLWDAIGERFDDFVLDNCASGGRRLDIEMTKRAMPLWRTDYDCNHSDSEVRQSQNMGISYWLPLTAGGINGAADNYTARSIMSAGGCMTTSYTHEDGLEKIAKEAEEICNIRPYWYGSYYALTTPTLDMDSWQIMELYREDWHKGVMLAFRRTESVISYQKIKLKGLLADHDYIIHDYDDNEGKNDVTMSGKELMEKGINITINQNRCAKIYTIEIVLNEEDK